MESIYRDRTSAPAHSGCRMVAEAGGCRRVEIAISLEIADGRTWVRTTDPLPTANGRRPESVKLLGWTEATAREVFLPRHEEAFDLRAEEAVAESPLHRPQVTL